MFVIFCVLNSGLDTLYPQEHPRVALPRAFVPRRFGLAHEFSELRRSAPKGSRHCMMHEYESSIIFDGIFFA